MSNNQTQTVEQIMEDTQHLLHLLAEEQLVIREMVETRYRELHDKDISEPSDN